MAISPNKLEHLSIEIRRIYEEAEAQLLSKMATRVSKGIDSSGWQELQLKQMRFYRAEVEEVIERLKKEGPSIMESVTLRSYADGIKSADDDLKKLGIKIRTREVINGKRLTDAEELLYSFGMSNTRTLENLVSSGINALEETHLQILRRTDDAFRQVVYEASQNAAAGIETRRQAAQKALNKLANKGIGGFIDSTGRVWDLATYTEMATRSAIGQAAIQGHVDRMIDQDRDLVIVSDHPDECPICRPWERKILSISGNDPRYPSLQEARDALLFHPNCGHNINAYVEGLTKIDKSSQEPENYDAKQNQRYMERQVRKFKRRQQVAITEKDKAKADQKVKQWQSDLREHTKEHGLRRKYERESISRAR